MRNGLKLSLVSILWLDAEDMEPGWGYIEPIKTLDPDRLTLTLGILAGEDDYFVYHASTFNQDTGEFAGRGKIPHGMIHSIEILETYYYEQI